MLLEAKKRREGGKKAVKILWHESAARNKKTAAFLRPLFFCKIIRYANQCTTELPSKWLSPRTFNSQRVLFNE